jgi:hypothetical protein
MGGEECTAGQGLHVCHFVCVIPSFTAVRHWALVKPEPSADCWVPRFRMQGLGNQMHGACVTNFVQRMGMMHHQRLLG